jgi:ubiquinone/menaquinone biosynthesis C-methylase UbiE
MTIVVVILAQVQGRWLEARMGGPKIGAAAKESGRLQRLRNTINPTGTRLKLSDLKRVRRAIGQFRQGFFYTINNGAYWDDYVKEWERTAANSEYQFLGNEWTDEEVFLELLEKFGQDAKRALEIGCGGGRITSKGVTFFGHVSACDVSREMLRKCREAVPAQNLSFHTLDGFTLAEFPDATIDFVYSHDVFVHFSSLQVFPYFLEMQRVLRPGGQGLISFYDFSRDFHTFRASSLQYWGNRRFPPHMRIHFTTEEMIRRMVAEAGLEVQSIDDRRFLIAHIAKPVGPSPKPDGASQTR